MSKTARFARVSRAVLLRDKPSSRSRLIRHRPRKITPQKRLSTAEKMKECHWLKPPLVGQFEFVEWTPDDHLRHARFRGLIEDRGVREVARER